PLGAWKADPTDGRRMLRRSPDEDNGTFFAVYQEGLVHEYDGFAFDQAPPRWGLDLNRNYPVEWGIESRQPGAGVYPLSEPETKAVADFVLAHPNIGGAATLHTTGGVILRPPGTKPEKKSNPHDIKILKAIGEMAAQETGYPSVNVYDEFLSDAANFSSGAFDDWLYATQGIPAYTVELWDLGLRSGVHMWPRKDKEEPELAEDYAKVLAWIDQENGGRGFIDWHHFQHPQLGEVEIGGFDTKFIVQNAPPELLEQECQKNASFFYRHARTLPRLSLEILEVKKLDTNTWRLSVQVSNLGYLPTYLTQQAKDIRVIPPATVELCGAAVLDGTARREIPQLEGRSAVSGSFQAGGYRGGPVARQKAQFSWIIKGEADTEVCVKVASRKAGNPQVHLKLSEQ
ncbi:MAG: hypothetical protein FWE76_02355, partial [Symbiobacteriaceae bacterium]|nr:hypothetical protein [Symbiobacteriaceae bacterium]